MSWVWRPLQTLDMRFYFTIQEELLPIPIDTLLPFFALMSGLEHHTRPTWFSSTESQKASFFFSLITFTSYCSYQRCPYNLRILAFIYPCRDKLCMWENLNCGLTVYIIVLFAQATHTTSITGIIPSHVSYRQLTVLSNLIDRYQNNSENDAQRWQKFCNHRQAQWCD